MNKCIICNTEFVPDNYHPYQQCCQNPNCLIKIRQRHARNRYKNNPKEYAYYRIAYTQKRMLIARSIIHTLKSNGCAICGYNKCDSALEFHHVKPEDKKLTITQAIWGNSNKIAVEELNKCILLCANCHKEIENRGRQYQ